MPRSKRLSGVSVGMVAALLLLAAMACTGARSTSTPTKAAGVTSSPAAPTATPTTIREVATPTASAGGVFKVVSTANDWMPAPPAADMAAQQILRTRVTGDIQSGQMDNAILTSNTMNTYLVMNNSKLLRMKFNSSEVVPDVAERWEISPDGKTLTFKLRQGVQWSRGGYGELVADDVVTHFKRMAGILDKEDGTGKYNSLWKANFALVTDMTAPDKYTVQFKFSEPDASFLRATLLYYPGMISKQKAMVDLGGKYQTDLPGTGPFILTKNEPGVKVELTKNPTFFMKGHPYLEKFESYVMLDHSVAELALKTGQLDVDRQITSDEILKRFEANPGDLSVQKMQGTGVQWIYVNQARAPLDNVKLRQALYYAVDWDSWVRDAKSGRAMKVFGVIAPKMLYYDEKCNTQYNYDVAKAKQLLAEAGYPNGTGLKTFEYVTGNTGDDPILAEFIKKYWSAIGVNLNLNIIASALRTERRNKGDYDFLPNGGGAHVFEPTMQMTRYYHSSNVPPGNNNSSYKGVDAEILAAKASYDPVARAKAVCDFLKKTSADVASIAYSSNDLYFIVNKKVQNIQTYDENGDYMPYETWIKK